MVRDRRMGAAVSEAFNDKPVCDKCGCDMTRLKWNEDKGMLAVYCTRCSNAWWMRGKDDPPEDGDE